MKTINDIINKIKELEDVKKYYEVANILNVSQSTFANWQTRGTIPYEVLLRYCKKKGLNLEWILTGEGHKYKITKQEVLKVMENNPYYEKIPKATLDRLFNLLSEYKIDEIEMIMKIIKKRNIKADKLDFLLNGLNDKFDIKDILDMLDHLKTIR